MSVRLAASETSAWLPLVGSVSPGVTVIEAEDCEVGPTSATAEPGLGGLHESVASGGECLAFEGLPPVPHCRKAGTSVTSSWEALCGWGYVAVWRGCQSAYRPLVKKLSFAPLASITRRRLGLKVSSKTILRPSGDHAGLL